ncbi:MAG: SOS response-associated peptidase, partial [Actinomyces sp.]
MCGRFVSATPPDRLAAYFDAEPPPPGHTLPLRYNVAPTSEVYGVYAPDGRRHLDTFHWGLVPFWARDPSIGNRMINARAESVADKPAYKRAFARRRCLVPVDGFYEWTTVPGRRRKQPWYITRVDDEPLALAGLWESWRDPDRTDDEGHPLELHSLTIITGDPNEDVAPVHDRMPVILPPAAWEEWLDPDERDTERLRRLLRPAPAGLLVVRPVSTEVNDARHEGPELIEPVELDSAETRD